MTEATEPEATEAPEETEAAPEPTKAELQDELREAGLPVSGTKAELIERLEEAEAEAETEAEEVEAEAEAEAEEAEAEAEAVGDALAAEAEAVAAEAEAAEDEEEVVVDADLVTEGGGAGLAALVSYAGEIRANATGFAAKLAEQATVLADFESRHTDPGQQALSAASARIRGHVDDVQRWLASLIGAAADLQTEAVTAATVPAPEPEAEDAEGEDA